MVLRGCDDKFVMHHTENWKSVAINLSIKFLQYYGRCRMYRMHGITGFLCNKTELTMRIEEH